MNDKNKQEEEIWSDGLTETDKDALRSFGEGAVDLAKQLGCDVSDIGVKFTVDAEGNPVAICFYDP